VSKKTRADSDFRSSLAMLEEDAVFAKAAPFGGPFEMAVHDLRHFLDHGVLPEQAETQRWAQGLMNKAKSPVASFTKALATLDQMTAALPAAAHRASANPVRFDRFKRELEADLVLKATNALMFNDQLNAAERGSLMLGLSAAHDRAFAKAQRADAHPVASQIEAIKTALEQARDTRDLSGPAATYLTEALRHIEQGITDQDDRTRLMSLLQQLKLALAAGDSDALGNGDQQ
jgi:hypothetical protein